MKNVLKFSAFALSVTLLVACGGGGGGATGSANNGNSDPGAVFATNAGSAAMGAAMSNAAISIQPLPASANTEILVTANDSGAFTVPAGTTFPALVKATSSNKQHTYYGYISSSSQVGIPVNPITTTILTLAAANNPATITTSISNENLTDARTKTATLFQSFLSAVSQTNTTDFLSKTFPTDRTGLDLMLDVSGVQISNNGDLIISNKITGTRTEVNPRNIAAIPFDGAAMSRLSNTPIQLCGNFLNGLSNKSMLSDISNYDVNFLDSGRDRSNFISNLINKLPSSVKISTPVFFGLNSSGNLIFNVEIKNSATNEYISDYPLVVKKDELSNKCLLVGNQHPFEITIQPAIKSLIRLDGLASNEVTKYTGIEIYIGAHNDWNFASNNIGAERINSSRVEVCDAADFCTILATLTNTGGAAQGIFSIDGSSANNNLKMIQNPNFSLFTDRSDPIKITFFSSQTAPLTGNLNSIGVITTRATAPAFTSAEVSSITMPSITNSSILAGYISNPTLQWVAGSGIITEIGVDSRNPLSDDSVVLLRGGAGATTFLVTDPVTPYYKSMRVSAHLINRPGMLETKYIWAPTCSGCI